MSAGRAMILAVLNPADRQNDWLYFGENVFACAPQIFGEIMRNLHLPRIWDPLADFPRCFGRLGRYEIAQGANARLHLRQFECRLRRENLQIRPCLDKIGRLCDQLEFIEIYGSCAKITLASLFREALRSIRQLIADVFGTKVDAEPLSAFVSIPGYLVVVYLRHCRVIGQSCCAQCDDRGDQRLPILQREPFWVGDKTSQRNDREHKQRKGEKIKSLFHRLKLPICPRFVERVAA